MFSSATTGGRLAGVEPELERRRARVGEQALLELVVDPGACDEPRAVGRRARDEPVDPRTHLLARDHALLDEQLLERPDARCGRRLAAVVDRVVRVVVVVVVVAHDVGSSQCSKTSAYSAIRVRPRYVGPELALLELDEVETRLAVPVAAVGARLRVRERRVHARDRAALALQVAGRTVVAVVRAVRDAHRVAAAERHASTLASSSPGARTPSRRGSSRSAKSQRS